MSAHNIKGNVSQLPVVDSTLTRSGYSADAKATGDAIAENKQRIEREAARLDSELDVERGKIDQIANNQIPVEYLEAAVDNYVKDNEAGLATKAALETVESELKSDLSKVLIMGTNMVDYSNLETGYYINEINGVPTVNANHCMVQWIPVKANTEYVFGLYSKEYEFYGNYTFNSGARISFYKADKTWISAFVIGSAGQNVFTTPSDTAFISISWNCSSLVLYPILSTGNTLPPYEDYTQVVNMELVDTYTKEEIDTMISEENYRPYTSVNGSMTDGTILAISENNVQKKNIELVFTADIATFESITVGMRHAYSGTLWNRITVDNQNIVAYDIGNADGVTYPHGLSIDNNIQVHIHKNYDLTADVTLVSNGNRFTQTISWHDFTQLVQPYAVSNGSTLTDCVFTMQLSDTTKDIWAFGDSYFNYSPSRWMYYADEANLTDKMMLDAHPGENSVSAIMSLETALLHGKPKFILWCMGMNDLSDSADAPNEQWLTNLETFLEVCENNGITPILATIPSVPNRNNEAKNAWVRTSGYRYIDFAKAVGATSSGVWYGEMLSSDNLHPSESGAKALYMRAIADFPELLIK